jgi:uncharacterized membrane protein
MISGSCKMYVSILAVALLAGCASGEKRPVFYPNKHLQAVGKAQAERDINACMRLATSSGVSRNKDGQVGRKAAAGGALGGAGAGAAGLIRGNALENALAGAAAGAAVGAVKGGIDSTDMNPTFKRFVQRCLKDKGYDVIGWE